ncbi:Rha family transcriptional regulator [Rhizobium sp.]|uniref:Rha family transcriptional regulator n=1 Tax=Rhizobium sp. TaxID=391 RepID=UPI0028B1F517
MNMLAPIPQAMTSLEITDLVNSNHADVRRSIERLAERGVITLPPTAEVPNPRSGPKLISVYMVGERESYIVVAQLSPEFTARLVDYWQAHKNDAAQIPTTAEAFAQAFRMLADAEQRDADRERRLNTIDAKVERIATAQTVLSARPANAESIVHLRKRIGKMFGLSSQTIDAVMRQSPYAPKPAGMVRNDRAEAEGSTYAVYWKKDVTATFDRFAKESTAVSNQFYTHPYIDGRFMLIRPID